MILDGVRTIERWGGIRWYYQRGFFTKRALRFVSTRELSKDIIPSRPLTLIFSSCRRKNLLTLTLVLLVYRSIGVGWDPAPKKQKQRLFISFEKEQELFISYKGQNAFFFLL